MLTASIFVASLLHSAIAAPIAARQANSIVLTLGADVGQNGGNGINNLQCNNGKLHATINLQASVNVNGIHDYQPMGETGFDGASTVVTATFTVGGQPGNVVAENVFNVGTSSTNGAVWSFAPNDDGPHPGGQFTLGDCSGNTIPPVSVSFACSPVTNAAGLPNGADGGPPVPLVNGPVTVVNALPAQFNGGSNGSAPAPAPAPAPSPSSAPSPSPAPAPSPAAGNNGGVAGTAGTSIHTVNTNPGSAWCGGNNQLIIQMGTTLNVVSSGIANSACRNGPMAECGLALLQGSVTANGAPVNVVSWSGGNQVFSGNNFQVQEADDSPYVGGQLLVDVPCSYSNAAQSPASQAATLAFAWTSLTSTVQVTDTNGNLINPPAAVVVQTAGAAAPLPTAAAPAPTAAAFTPAPATGGNTGASSIVLTLGGENGGNGVNSLQCNNGKLQATVNLQASVNVNGIHDYQPMGETGFDGKSTFVTATFTVDGKPGNVVAQNTFNVGTSSTSGATWTFAPNDDGPHPGGQFTLGDCTGNTIPSVTIAFSCSPVTTAAGLPNGADGGPPVPLVNGPVTVVNALPAQFNGGTTGSAPAPAPAPASQPAPTSAPAPAPTPVPAPVPTQNNGGATGTAGTSIHTVNTNPGGAWCGGNNQLIIQMGTTLNVVSSGIANSACRNGPMAECGLALLQGSVTANGAPVNVVSWGGGNQVSSGNTFQVQEADDSPYVGGQLLVDVPCSYTNAAQNPKTQLATLAFAWTSLTPTVQVQDTNGNPISPPAAVVVKTA